MGVDLIQSGAPIIFIECGVVVTVELWGDENDERENINAGVVGKCWNGMVRGIVDLGAVVVETMTGWSPLYTSDLLDRLPTYTTDCMVTLPGEGREPWEECRRPVKREMQLDDIDTNLLSLPLDMSRQACHSRAKLDKRHRRSTTRRGRKKQWFPEMDDIDEEEEEDHNPYRINRNNLPPLPDDALIKLAHHRAISSESSTSISSSKSTGDNPAPIPHPSSLTVTSPVQTPIGDVDPPCYETLFPVVDLGMESVSTPSTTSDPPAAELMIGSHNKESTADSSHSGGEECDSGYSSGSEGNAGKDWGIEDDGEEDWMLLISTMIELIA